MNRGVIISLIILLTLSLASRHSEAQHHAKNWYFGNKAGLVFNDRFPMPVSDGQLESREGVAVISDSLGNLVFYSNGHTVWNANHEIIANGLTGDPLSTMSATILPLRMHPDRYALFTTSVIVNENGNPLVPDGGQYYIFDFSAENPDGVKLSDYQSLGTGPVQSRSVEKFLGIPFPDQIIGDSLQNPGYWLITHEFDNTTFKISHFDEQYVPFNEINIGQSHSNGSADFGANRGATGYMVASLQGDKIAVAIEGQKMFEVFRFNKETGQLSRAWPALPAGNPDRKKEKLHYAYGLAFSPSGRFLYGTSRDEGILYQWDLESPNVVEEAYILRHNHDFVCGALQLAPNGKIYVAVDGQDYLGVINRPDKLGKRSYYQEFGVTLVNNETGEGGKSTLGLPRFDMSDHAVRHFGYDHNCFGDSTILYMAGETSSGYSPQTTFTILDPASGETYWILSPDQYLMAKYPFPAPGEYDIRVQSRYKGVVLDFTERIRILEPPRVALAEDYTRLCRGDSLILDAGDGAFYEWADESFRDRRYVVTEEDFQQIPLQEYRVKVTDYSGCVGWDTVYVEIKNPPEVEVVATRAVCGEPTGSATVTPKGGVENYYFSWEDFPDITSNKIENVRGGDYIFYVKSIYAGCRSAQVATVPELGVANVTIVASTTDTVCPGTPIRLTVVGDGATEYEWIQPFEQAGSVIEDNPLSTTTYEVRVTAREGDDFCDTTLQYTVPVQKVVIPEMEDLYHRCEGETLQLLAPEGFEEYEWSNGLSGREIELSQTYEDLVLTVADRFGCQSSTTLSAFFHAAPEVDLGDDFVVCSNDPVQLHGGEGQNYLWSTGDTTASLYVNRTDTYWLRIGHMGCYQSDTLQARFLDPDLLQIDSVSYRDISCAGANDGSIRIYVGEQGYDYLYSLDGGSTFLNNGGIFRGLRAGDNYEVAVMQDSVCTKVDPQLITIREPEEISFEFVMTSPGCMECYDGSIAIQHLQGGMEPYTIQWSTLDTGVRLSGLGPGYYSVTVRDANQCQKSSQIFLELGFRIPNAFTPNGDGINDYWDVKPLELYPECMVKIYAMDGTLVFDSPQGYPTPWDGTYNGAPLPMGTYYYMISLSAGEKAFTGNLTLIR